MRGLALAFAVLLAAGAEAGTGTEAKGVLSEFTTSAIWDDGRAEISIYDTRGSKYGVERSYETRITIVKEDVLIGSWEKSERGPIPGRTVEALKVILQQDIPTGTYSYHQSAMMHLDRALLIPYALAMNSIDGCGLASASLVRERDSLRFRGSSYWEGEARLDTVLDASSMTVFHDALPVWVRTLRSTGGTRVSLLPSQLSNHVRVPRREDAEVIVEEGAGDSVLVRVRHLAGEDAFWLGPAPERPLVRWEKADGSVLVLRKRLRLAYWEHTKPGDEALLR